jgi:hypothetical protein
LSEDRAEALIFFLGRQSSIIDSEVSTIFAIVDAVEDVQRENITEFLTKNSGNLSEHSNWEPKCVKDIKDMYDALSDDQKNSELGVAVNNLRTIASEVLAKLHERIKDESFQERKVSYRFKNAILSLLGMVISSKGASVEVIAEVCNVLQVGKDHLHSCIDAMREGMEYVELQAKLLLAPSGNLMIDARVQLLHNHRVYVAVTEVIRELRAVFGEKIEKIDDIEAARFIHALCNALHGESGEQITFARLGKQVIEAYVEAIGSATNLSMFKPYANFAELRQAYENQPAFKNLRKRMEDAPMVFGNVLVEYQTVSSFMLLVHHWIVTHAVPLGSGSIGALVGDSYQLSFKFCPKNWYISDGGDENKNSQTSTEFNFADDFVAMVKEAEMVLSDKIGQSKGAEKSDEMAKLEKQFEKFLKIENNPGPGFAQEDFKYAQDLQIELAEVLNDTETLAKCKPLEITQSLVSLGLFDVLQSAGAKQIYKAYVRGMFNSEFVANGVRDHLQKILAESIL